MFTFLGILGAVASVNVDALTATDCADWLLAMSFAKTVIL